MRNYGERRDFQGIPDVRHSERLTWRKKGMMNFGQVEPVDVRSMIGSVSLSMPDGQT